MASGFRQTAAGLANNSESGTTSPFPSSVAKYYSRSTGPRYRLGLSTKVSLETLPKGYSANHVHGKRELYERGNNKITKQRGNYPRKILSDRFLQSDVPSPKKGRLFSPSHRSQSIKPLCDKRTLPDGKLAMRKTNYKSTGFYGQVGPQGRVSHGQCASRLSEIPEVHLAGPGLSVPSPAIWPEHSTAGFHKITQTSGCLSSHTKHQITDLSGRHSSGGVKCFDFATAHECSDKPTPRSGVHNQFRKVDSDTNPDIGVSRIHNQFSDYEVLFTSREDNENVSPVQVPNAGESNILTPPISTVGFSRVLSASCMACPSPLSAPSVMPDRAGCVEQWGLSRYGPPEQTSSRGTAVVDIEYPSGQRKSNSPPLIRNDYHIRCLQVGLGGNVWQTFNQRALVTRGELSSHKCSGTEGSISCHTIIPETSIKHSSETSPGQYDSCLLHQQPGRNTLSEANVSYTRTMELVSTTQHISEGRIPPRCPERPSGQRIESVHRFERLENTVKGNKTFPQRQGNRPVCLQIDESTATVCKLAPGSSRLRDGRVYRGLESPEGICFSPVQLDSSNTDEGERRQCDSSFSSTNLASATLVAPLTRAGNKLTSSSPAVSKSPGGSVQCRGHSSNVPQAPVGRLGHLQRRCSTEGFSSTTTRLLSSATRQSTNKAYDSAWGKWSRWCDTREIDPISANLRDILSFLSDQFDNNLQYRTINVFRSAISSVHQWVDGKPVGQHPTVIRLMKGIANERPFKPRYSSTWDVSRVTSYLSSLGDNDKLCLRLLTKKLLMLLALISPERSSVLSDLNIQFLKKQPDGFTFTLTKPRKTGDPRSLTTIAFPSFTEDNTLCPLKCLESYLNATREFRTLPECEKLFLSIIRPHRPVSKGTIARWLCDTISASGIDSSIFKAHSTRAASTSTAAKKQLPLNDILKMADWTSASTFQRFYYKPTIDDSYAKTVLKA